MKVKITKNYEVSFEDTELVEALVHWISHVRGRTDMIDVSVLMNNNPTTVTRKNKKIVLRFSLDPDEDEF